MTGAAGPAEVGVFWHALGIAGVTIFFGRFYVQWIASEIKKRSVIPVIFWYMSSVGSVLVFAYAVKLRSPGMAFGQTFNIIVYSRNLVHIWRERGRLTPSLNVAVHTGVALFVVLATVLMLRTWYLEYKVNEALPDAQAARNWFWLGVWFVGQGLFTLRFLVQWLATEMKRKSVVPPAFWYFSLAASLLQSASYFQRHEWVNAIGTAATIPVYARNLWLVHSVPAEAEPGT